MQSIKVSCVSYINSAPFVYGLLHHKIAENIVLSLDNPADCALKLRDGLVDIGLIPVAAISSIPQPFQVSDWCIGANGPVKSVMLFSKVPLHEVQQIFLDFQSVTSNMLTKILAQHFWKVTPEFLPAYPGFEKNIKGNTAAVVIGDRALQWHNMFAFNYDLSAEWKQFTGLPFVFARWVCNRKPDDFFLNQFNEALSYGIENTEKVIVNLKSAPGYLEGTDDYLKNNLSYHFDHLKKQGMELFLDYAKSFSVPEVRVLL